MRYLKSYKIFEADAPLDPTKWSWTKDLTIPRDMQMDIYDMAFELKDEGYNVSYQWWPPYQTSNSLYKDNKYPSINITKSNQNEEGGLEKIYYPWIEDFCQRITSYLDEKGYNAVVKCRKDNSRDYINVKDSVMDWGPFGDKPMANSIHFKIEMISRRVYGDVYESGNTSFDWLRKQNNERYIDLMYILQSDIFDEFKIVSKTDETFSDDGDTVYPEHKFWVFRMQESRSTDVDTSNPDEIGDKTIDYMIVFNIQQNEKDRFWNEVLSLKEKVQDLIGKELVISEEIIDDGYNYDYIIKLV